IGPNGDLFVSENSSIVRYTQSFKSAHPLAQTTSTYALNVNSIGDLIYLAASSVYVLKSPYTGKPQIVYTSQSGVTDQIVTAP
ncbi:MAG: hypothetical protein JO302_04475, partial [Candidatus Eremiobacteraeota bacterium]|nr:hypothetical protein [Candidatus Eremiobacteraeota bacterium]